MSRRPYLLIILALVAALALVGCAGADETPAAPAATEPPPATVTETAQVEASPATVTSFQDPHPDTFIRLVTAEPTTLDPALAYDIQSAHVLDNVLEGLIAVDPANAGDYIPALATDVPDPANGLISSDGLTYTFPIRTGVVFHDGATLTPSDVAYSIQRGLLQSDPTGPQWLLLEPILGYSSGDITEEIDDGAYAGDAEALRANASPEALLATCERIKAAVVAEDEAGTVTIHLTRPWGPFLAVVANFVKVIDQDWAAANGDWDGDCATWQDYYAPGVEASPLTGVANGTGPYRLERRTPGEEIVLSAHEAYWRDESTPYGDGGPYGVARVPEVLMRLVPEWGTRLAALESRDADFADVPTENESQVAPLVGESCDYRTGACTANPENPDGFLRQWPDLPAINRADLFMNFAISPESPYIGSGQLDGEGIPPDFFSDVNVRRAMAACFDYDTYIAEAQDGRGVRSNGPLIPGVLGYNPDGPMYAYDPAACEAHLAEAWGGVLPETGFRFTIVYAEPIPGANEAAAVLASGLAAVNEKYRVETLGLAGQAFFGGMFGGQHPIAYSGWFEDAHDPHYWAQPFTVGSYGAAAQSMPEELLAQFGELVQAGVAASDPSEREQAYFALQQLFHEQAPTIILSQRPNSRYEPRWVKGYRYLPGIDPPYYLLSTTP